MREFLQFHLFSGHAWFTAAAIVTTIAIIDFSRIFERARWFPPAVRVLTLLSIGLALLSGTPLPLPVAGVLLVVLAAYGATVGHFKTPWARLLPLAVALMAASAGIAEVPYHRDPEIAVRNVQEIVVIGDSLSSGGFGEKAAWPHLLASATGLTLRDMSVAGMRSTPAADAYVDVLERLAPATLVIIEIGGNDVLEGVNVAEFSRGLEALVRAARGATPYVLVVELPVLPGGWRFGKAQRDIVARYGATMIPKHFLAGFLTDGRNTSDGLHPTQRGHEVFAKEITAMLEQP